MFPIRIYMLHFCFVKKKLEKKWRDPSLLAWNKKETCESRGRWGEEKRMLFLTQDRQKSFRP